MVARHEDVAVLAFVAQDPVDDFVGFVTFAERSSIENEKGRITAYGTLGGRNHLLLHLSPD